MSNSTQTFKLYEVLKSGQPVTVEKIAEELSIKIPSVPVYIHGLKKLKGKIEPVREGRKVVSYKLTNASDVIVMEFRRNSANAQRTPPKPSIISIQDNSDIVPNITYSDKEIVDIAISVEKDITKGALAD